MSKKIVVPRLSADVPLRIWRRKFETGARQQKLIFYLDPANETLGNAPDRYPVCKTAAEIIKHVRPKPALRAKVDGLAHNTSEANVDSEMIAIWAEVQQENAKQREDHKERQRVWPLNRDVLFGMHASRSS